MEGGSRKLAVMMWGDADLRGNAVYEGGKLCEDRSAASSIQLVVQTGTRLRTGMIFLFLGVTSAPPNNCKKIMACPPPPAQVVLGNLQGQGGGGTGLPYPQHPETLMPLRAPW